MAVHIYGIRNCDTMKKAFAWFRDAGIDYDFHDYRKELPTLETFEHWCVQAGWESLLNRRGTTWRKLGNEDKAVASPAAAAALMHTHPSVIRRPLIITADGRLVIGFDPVQLEAIFGNAQQ